MSLEQIKIDRELCNGCGICVQSCTMDVIRMDEKSKKAVAKYPEDCMLCDLCELDCPQKAIYVIPDKYMPLLVGWG